jgi:Uma2 family endonuclease
MAEDLEAMPDDGHRYELVDGSLLVTPSPNRAHQRCLKALLFVLEAGCLAGYEVMVSPFDFKVGPNTVLIPDLLVARTADLGPQRIERPPALVVEILSPSTRRIDLGTKRLAFEGAGVPTYWIVDPDGPSLTVLQLEDGQYREQGSVTGDERYEGTQPFPVTVVPARLLPG